jgi:hypothetical protein
LRGRKADPLSVASPAQDGVVLGRRLQGDRVLPVRDGQVVWDFDQLRQPALVLGASGKGKTETLKRLLHEVATKKDWPVAVLDAKGDPETAEWFLAMAEATGRRARLFPHERFDGWRGDWRAIVNRLLQVIPYGKKDAPGYYRDLAKTMLQTACRMGDGPPRSSREFLDRLSMDSLAKQANGTVSKALTEELLAQARMRYEAFFGQVGTVLDGDWAWEDTDAAYFLLDSLGEEEDAASAAAFLFADFGHYFKVRKPREQSCILAVDEFSAVAEMSKVAKLVEQARGYNAFLLLAPQTVEGMGSVTQQSRILGSVDMLICHGTKEPERIAALAGERQAPAITQRYEKSRPVDEIHLRLENRPCLQSDQIRELRRGDAWLIRDNKAMKITVSCAPQMKIGGLPDPEDIEVPIERKGVDGESEEAMRVDGPGQHAD